MKRVIMIVSTFVLVATTAAAQSASSRAWQQRMDVEIPLPVPMVELLSVNPFAIIVDETPKVLQASAPRKVDIRGVATVATFVDAKGVCLGAVPLELPVPGLTASLVEDLNGSRFDPAIAGGLPQPSWVVLEIGMEGKIKESEIVDQSLEMPNPETPSVPNQPVAMKPPGNLRNLKATPQTQLTKLAAPRRIKVSAPGRDDEVHIRALLHVTENGRCDRYVPLELYDGLNSWFSGYLATWRMQPASRDGAPVAVWVEYSARVRMKISGISSTTSRVVRDREYTPVE
ncbi:MAG: hypothetical protein IFK93_04440 [Acidobacteria bacterium]|uniref:Uncharacterized protein n=1 Tax=Candidatus Sulfomarinibacter kjeldsenii TaxID=2885994 RepID=A0A8J7C4X1_9BACT|nr:hypothetical protein [Candidatus Sulfomarinibacter kjeldsenii]MBD3856135.1 hypothetical protein [Candidatus Sulfomarinibacter kjeldsenii]MBD3870456.1 hypothetical protein [Candidatus Sulfomarinibacter kjeldsenii]